MIVRAKKPTPIQILPACNSIYPAYPLKGAMLTPDIPVPPLKLNIIVIVLVCPCPPTFGVAKEQKQSAAVGSEPV